MATSAFKSTTKRTPISSPSNAAAESGSSTKPHRRSRSLSLFSRLLPNPPEFAFIQAKCLETGETMAMKKVLQDRRYKNHELQLMRLTDHPNVVSLKHCFFSTRSKDKLFLNLVMEYVPETMCSVLKHYSSANQRMPLIYVKLYSYQSFEDAWKATCSAREVSGFSPTMHVPDGYEFLLLPVIFSGPCNSETVNVVIDGNLTAPSHPSKWKCDGSNCRQWIGFIEINGLYIYGSGTINAQGTKWWGSSDVNHNRKYHGSKPTGFVIAHSNNVHISDLTFIDSPQMHMALERSTWVYVYNLTITAPGDSPNTDGIHIQHSTHVFISQTHIGTGDDCISIGDGSSYLNISMITCGPGHGISIGSLGIRGQYETVENVYVSNVEFRGTSNGARIKTWQGGNGFARNIVFEHIRSIGSAHPIIIDQYYCDHTHCKNQKSAVQISNIRYSYIYGTSEEDTAIHFACSETVPCKDIYMNDIYLQSTQLCKETTSLCQNVAGRKNGPVLPSVPCLTD